MRKLIACVVAAAVLGGCGKEPNSIFDTAGYHVRGDTVYYLEAFPGKAFEVTGADAASFEVLDATYARDNVAVYVDGRPLPGADPSTFELTERPRVAKDRQHVYVYDRILSDDPAHFELMDGELSKDSTAVYWSDGSVLSDDPTGFVIISNADWYLFTKDSRTVHVNGNPIDEASPDTFDVLSGAYARDARHVFYFTSPIPTADLATFAPIDGPYAADARAAYWMGKPIAGADPATFTVLNADFECSADAVRAYFRDMPISGADPASFPPGKAVTGCTETSISFAE